MAFLGSTAGLLSKVLGGLENHTPKNTDDDTPRPFPKRTPPEKEPVDTGTTRGTNPQDPIDLTDSDTDDDFIDKFKDPGRTTNTKIPETPVNIDDIDIQPSDSNDDLPIAEPISPPASPIIGPVEPLEPLPQISTTPITQKILRQNPKAGSKSFISTDKQNLETLHKSFINVYEEDDQGLLKKYGI